MITNEPNIEMYKIKITDIVKKYHGKYFWILLWTQNSLFYSLNRFEVTSELFRNAQSKQFISVGVDGKNPWRFCHSNLDFACREFAQSRRSNKSRRPTFTNHPKTVQFAKVVFLLAETVTLMRSELTVLPSFEALSEKQ